MRNYRKHCHVRPDFCNAFRFCVDYYGAAGSYEGTNHNLTKQEAHKRMRKARRRLATGEKL